jgi:hypothetical protein
MKSLCGFRSLILMSGFLGAPALFGAAADRQQAQAQVLDHAELLCDNCFFGPSYYYYCFAVENKVLIGYQRTQVLNWEDKSKNSLTHVHPAWKVWNAPAETIPLSYDDKHIWVARPDGKQVKLHRTSSGDFFTNNNQCREAARSKPGEK